MARRVRHEQVREHVDDVDGLELASDADRQALVRELVDDVEHSEPPSVVRPVLGRHRMADRASKFFFEDDAQHFGHVDMSEFCPGCPLAVTTEPSNSISRRLAGATPVIDGTFPRWQIALTRGTFTDDDKPLGQGGGP